MSAGILHVVATPIGNLQDLSPRARQTLQDADIVVAEDTRHTGKLLAHFGISARQVALHDHNESEVLKRLIGELQNGKTIALVSDAGTPLISDPGFQLVRAAHGAGIAVSPVPGPSAAIAAISAAGIASDRFAFEGFLPAKREARLAALERMRHDTRTLIFFESVHRIEQAIADMLVVLGERQAFIARELSKLHEQCVNASLAQISERLTAGEIVSKGEFVVVVEGAVESDDEKANVDADELLKELVQHMPGSQAVDIVSKLSGLKRNDVYKRMLELR